MKRIIVIAIVAICVWMMYAFPHAMLNPGELISGHQELNNKCNSCHNPFWGVSSEKCIACHKLDEIGKDSLKNNGSILFHRNLKDQECTTCHTEHKGIKPINSLSNFDHGFLSASEKTKCNNCHSKPVDNLHRQLSTDCNSCHNTNGWKSAVSFNHDMIQGADKSNCLSCHQKPKDVLHESFKNNCLQCHSSGKWVPSSFDHSSYFQLDQNHNAKCNICHNNSDFKQYTCFGCHEHSESNIRNEHDEEGISNLNNCIACHKSANKHEMENSEHSNGNGRKENGGGEKDDD
ncbi:MAG: hypothetical protein NTX97_02855 [Bacteroidetes bacterium]|nr:hypothetical protein [Bacteroidota bacterium]